MNILESLKQSKQNKLLENQNKLQPCHHCGSSKFELKKVCNKDGKEVYPYFCASCGMRLRICEKKSIAIELGFIDL
jgi:hypothetical protein